MLGLMSLWAAAAAFFLAILGMGRLPLGPPCVLSSKRFSVVLPDTLHQAGISPRDALWPCFVLQKGHGAVSTVCPHLGCIVKGQSRRL